MIAKKQKIRKPKNKTLGKVYGGWIKYQLDLVGVTCTDIAEEIGVRDNSVWYVIHGMRTSARIQQKVADKLNLSNWDAVLKAAKKAKESNIV
ncbi:MAG: hypothetical protein P1P64_02800 [Treponemataceae bacterium]